MGVGKGRVEESVDVLMMRVGGGGVYGVSLVVGIVCKRSKKGDVEEKMWRVGPEGDVVL